MHTYRILRSHSRLIQAVHKAFGEENIVLDNQSYYEVQSLLEALRSHLEVSGDEKGYGMICEALGKYRIPFSYFNDEIEDKVEYADESAFEKVIFLDIDGVLNDEEHTSESYLDTAMVGRLKKIIDETGAEVILSSSWRGAFREYLQNRDNKYMSEEKKLSLIHGERAIEIFDTLNDYGISIAGMTDDMLSGSLARPLEIRRWLLEQPNLKSFAILDDDSFWQWGWLSAFWVETSRCAPDSSYKRQSGLSDENVEQAIRILNDYSAVRRLDRDALREHIEWEQRFGELDIEKLVRFSTEKYQIDRRIIEKIIRGLLSEGNAND